MKKTRSLTVIFVFACSIACFAKSSSKDYYPTGTLENM